MTGSRRPADDLLAIQQQLYRYCRAMDRMDAALGYSMWHDDGEADYGEAIFRGTGRDFVDFVTRAHATMIAHSHQITNMIVELADDQAASESYVTAALRLSDGDDLKQVTIRGRYLDRWSCRGGWWAIDRRVYVHDFDDVRIIREISIPGNSARDRSDPSYAVLSNR